MGDMGFGSGFGPGFGIGFGIFGIMFVLVIGVFAVTIVRGIGGVE